MECSSCFSWLSGFGWTSSNASRFPEAETGREASSLWRFRRSVVAVKRTARLEVALRSRRLVVQRTRLEAVEPRLRRTGVSAEVHRGRLRPVLTHDLCGARRACELDGTVL